MSAYVDGRFIQEFAKRTSHNLRRARQKKPLAYQDTFLISSLLAVFVLPHERADSDSFMVEILQDYGQDLDKVVKIICPPILPKDKAALPQSIADVPAFLRHAVSHLNIKPQSADGQNLTHLLIWNRPNPGAPVSFVASVHVRRLRALASFILDRIAAGTVADKYETEDPIESYRAAHGDKLTQPLRLELQD